jgi:hypothetical protein
VALWALGFVRASVRARKEGYGSGSSLTVANLKLCVYYLRHMERVQRQPVPNAINLVLVLSYRDQQRHEVGFKKTAEEPEIFHLDIKYHITANFLVGWGH